MRIIPPPELSKIIQSSGPVWLPKLGNPDVAEFVRRSNDSYVHWHKLRYYKNLPDGLDPEQCWGAIALSRHQQYQVLPIQFTSGSRLVYWSPPQQLEWLHKIDQQAGGTLGSDSAYLGSDEAGKDKYLFNSLMEEAIASSQLEGAVTTRRVAKQMLREGRKPQNKAEQMIFNNYCAVLKIRDCQKDNLTPKLLKDLHSILTSDTFEDSSNEGQFRQTDNVVVEDSYTHDVLHRPPLAASLDNRIEEICDFANNRSRPFVHPVTKAIILHFTIGYLHPFVDGNGRTARAVFYWYMLKNGYWLFEFLPISRLFLMAPLKYARSYVYTETDREDVTYFIQYNLHVIIRAIKDLHSYLVAQQKKISEAAKLLDSSNLNHRQQSLISHALKHQDALYTIQQHMRTYNVSYGTARLTCLTSLKPDIYRSCGKRTKRYSTRMANCWQAPEGVFTFGTADKPSYSAPSCSNSRTAARHLIFAANVQPGAYDDFKVYRFFLTPPPICTTTNPTQPSPPKWFAAAIPDAGLISNRGQIKCMRSKAGLFPGKAALGEQENPRCGNLLMGMMQSEPKDPSDVGTIDWQSALAQHDRWWRTDRLMRVGEPQAVDEVMQEVSLAAVRQRAPLEDPTKVAPWLYRLAVTQSLLYRRKQGRRRRLTDRDGAVSPQRSRHAAERAVGLADGPGAAAIDPHGGGPAAWPRRRIVAVEIHGRLELSGVGRAAGDHGKCRGSAVAPRPATAETRIDRVGSSRGMTMSRMGDKASRISDEQLDRLVDGELSEPQRRELLSGLDREPEGWRRSPWPFSKARVARGDAFDVGGGRPSAILQPGNFSAAPPVLAGASHHAAGDRRQLHRGPGGQLDRMADGVSVSGQRADHAAGGRRRRSTGGSAGGLGPRSCRGRGNRPSSRPRRIRRGEW